MRTFSLALMLFGALGCLTETGFAQDSFSCTQCVCVADNTCDATGGCNGGDTGCKGTSFTASCTGQYTLRYAFDCSGSACEQCYACVFLKDESGNVLGVAHGNCSSLQCSGEGDSPTLTAGQLYKIYVCKRACNGGNCSNCTNCIARGYVYIQDWSACNTIPACNP